MSQVVTLIPRKSQIMSYILIGWNIWVTHYKKLSCESPNDVVSGRGKNLVS